MLYMVKVLDKFGNNLTLLYNHLFSSIILCNLLHGHPYFSYLSFGLLQCTVHGAALKDHLKAASDVECSGMHSFGDPTIYPSNTTGCTCFQLLSGYNSGCC